MWNMSPEYIAQLNKLLFLKYGTSMKLTLCDHIGISKNPNIHISVYVFNMP